MMTHFLSHLQCLRPVDILIIGFTNLLSVVGIFAFLNVPWIITLIPINFILAFAIQRIALTYELRQSKMSNVIYDWYPIPTIFLIFKEVHIVIQSLDRQDWDKVFIAIDRAIFGTDPTVWLLKFSFPLSTELLQIAYASYYFIMLAVGVELYFRKDFKSFYYAVFTTAYGFALSYLGYLTFPAIGPRFTLHDFGSLNTELPGLWLTNTIREFINAGESISKGASNAMSVAQRDVFPSGHTQMTLISLYFAHHYKLKSRFVLFVFGSLLILSTVYLRYHYVIDVLGGIIFMWITLLSAPKLYYWWEGIRKRKQNL